MTPKTIHILLADDSEDDVYLIRKAFDAAKLLHIMTAVGDGEEALAYLRREGAYKNATLPSLVILDINMPGMDGFQALHEIKADPALKHLPVVMLTTSKQQEDVVKSYSDGACSFVTKPVGLQEFQEAAKRFEQYWTTVASVPEG